LRGRGFSGGVVFLARGSLPARETAKEELSLVRLAPWSKKNQPPRAPRAPRVELSLATPTPRRKLQAGKGKGKEAVARVTPSLVQARSPGTLRRAARTR